MFCTHFMFFVKIVLFKIFFIKLLRETPCHGTMYNTFLCCEEGMTLFKINFGNVHITQLRISTQFNRIEVNNSEKKKEKS